jgi:hypothetical protein
MHIHRENEFLRNAILENRVVFLSSRCRDCGHVILASSANELLEEEERHSNECTSRHNTVRIGNRRH